MNFQNKGRERRIIIADRGRIVNSGEGATGIEEGICRVADEYGGYRLGGRCRGETGRGRSRMRRGGRLKKH